MDPRIAIMFYINNISCVLATSVEYVCVTNDKKIARTMEKRNIAKMEFQQRKD